MKYIIGVLLLSLGAVSWVAYDYKNKFVECKELPDIRTSFSHVSKYIGTDRSFRFTLVCSGEITDFYSECTKTDMVDVTNTQVVLKPYKDGQALKSSYALDWVEKINYFVDLSNPDIWDIDSNSSKIIISVPEIEFERVLDNKKLLPFVIDKKIFKNDKDYLLKIIEKSDEFSLPKSKLYLVDNKDKINEEMAESLKRLVSNVANKMNYPSETNVSIDIDGKVY